jgi:hypothetical protein
MGPKKKSKEEIAAEKAAKEEEDRIAAEKEKKRLEELAEKQRLEEIRVAEERAAERKIEIDRLTLEYMSYLDYFQEKDMKKSFDEANEAAKLEWEKIRNPVDTPDANSAKDINTFITLAQTSGVSDMKEVLDSIEYMVKVAASVEQVWGDAIAKKDNEVVANTTDYIERINAVILKNLDAGMASYLRFVDKHLNEKQEIQEEKQAGKVMMGFWGSMSDMRPIRKSVQFETIGIQLDIPKQILQQENKFIHRVIKIPLDPKSMADFIKKDRKAAKAITGGAANPEEEKEEEKKEESAAEAMLETATKQVLADLYYLDIIVPPGQAYEIRSKRWVIRDKSEKATNLSKIPHYPSTIATRVFLKVPDHIIVSNDVRVNLWNEEAKDWTEEHITDFQFSEATRLCQFMMTSVGIIALVKDKLSAYPLREWTLAPTREVVGLSVESKSNEQSLEEQKAVLTVRTTSHVVAINIDSSTVSLAKTPDMDPAIEALVGVQMNPGMLLTTLRKHGINLLCSDEDVAACEKQVGHIKDEVMESDVYLQMSQCASAFEFSSTSWNKDLTAQEVGLLVRETTVYNAVSEAWDYECIAVERDSLSQSFRWAPDLGDVKGAGPSGARYTNVVGNHYGTRAGFDNSARPGEVPHIELVESLRGRCTPGAYDRARRTHGTFSDTIFTLLSLMRPLSLTKQE